MSGVLVTAAPLAHLRWRADPKPNRLADPPLVVLLHGVGGGRSAWGEGPASTGALLAAAGYTVLAVDFPGYGLTPTVAPYDLAGLAASVQALIEAQGPGPATVVGHSMGGMVAQELAARAPQVVAALVLASTSPAFGKPGGDWQREFLQSRFAPLDAGLGMAGLAAQLVPSMVAPATPPERIAAAQALMSTVPEATYRSAVAALVSFDRRANLPLISAPTLVITGEYDRTAAPEVARRMAERIAGAQLAIVTGVGHLLNIESPAAFNTALLAFLPQRQLPGEPPMSNVNVPNSVPSSAPNLATPPAAVVTRYQPSHIAGNPKNLTPLQRDLISRMAALGPCFAARAERYDREASFPFENYDDLRQAGFLGICVPTAYGGMGADFATYVMVAAELGRWCGATALSFNMHVCSCLWAGDIADALDMTPEQRADHETNRAHHFGRIVNEGRLYAQPFSEGGAAAAGAAPWGTIARKVAGGYVVSGKKIFASLAGAADTYGVLCTLDRPDRAGGGTRRDSMYLAVPATAPGVTVVGDWDPLGMRGTVSRNLLFADVFVPETARMMPEGVYFQAASRYPHMFATLSPTYMGVAQAAYDFTVQYLRAEVPGMPPVKRRMYPTKQYAVAEMRIKLEATRALFLQNARDACIDPDKDARMRLYAAHYTIMESANDICRLAVRTCGGQSMLKSLPLERLYRDSRCGSLMLPWTAELCMDRLGRECLYEAGERDEAIE